MIKPPLLISPDSYPIVNLAQGGPLPCTWLTTDCGQAMINIADAGRLGEGEAEARAPGE